MQDTEELERLFELLNAHIQKVDKSDGCREYLHLIYVLAMLRTLTLDRLRIYGNLTRS